MILQKGDSGPLVTALQKLLNFWFMLGIRVDGDFGPTTRRAVLVAQRVLEVKDDGKWGPNSVAAFEAWKLARPGTSAGGLQLDAEDFAAVLYYLGNGRIATPEEIADLVTEITFALEN